jgi:hypothetical protein
VQFFPAWQSAIGLPWVMVCFAGLALLAVVFVAGYLPETKGLSVEHITRIFARDADRGMLAPTRGEQRETVTQR